jgi:hypothetical protein
MQVRMNLAVALALFVAPQTAQEADAVLSKFGLKPATTVVAVDGKATLAEGELIELVGACDLAKSDERVWDASGRLLDGVRTKLFWDIMDLPTEIEGLPTAKVNPRKEFASDDDGRTFLLAFKLSPRLKEANDVREDLNKTILVKASETRPAKGTGPNDFVGEMRVLKPIVPKDYEGNTFDFRLEVPGGEWTKLAEFPFGPDTAFADGLIDVKMRWQSDSAFQWVENVQTIVDFKKYYFTVTLPPPLRAMELEIVSNEPPEDLPYLPGVQTQYVRGEDQGAAFKGKDLFIVHGLNKRSETRKFTLRARPKRIVEFRGVPFKRG